MGRAESPWVNLSVFLSPMSLMMAKKIGTTKHIPQLCCVTEGLVCEMLTGEVRPRGRLRI